MFGLARRREFLPRFAVAAVAAPPINPVRLESMSASPSATRGQLFGMMVLEFFIWGAWLPLIFGYLPSLDFTPGEQSMILNAFPVASIVGMFFSQPVGRPEIRGREISRLLATLSADSRSSAAASRRRSGRSSG
jgi:hypothetical protein